MIKKTHWSKYCGKNNKDKDTSPNNSENNSNDSFGTIINIGFKVDLHKGETTFSIVINRWIFQFMY